jgi:hypothetical protein
MRQGFHTLRWGRTRYQSAKLNYAEIGKRPVKWEAVNNPASISAAATT